MKITTIREFDDAKAYEDEWFQTLVKTVGQSEVDGVCCGSDGIDQLGVESY